LNVRRAIKIAKETIKANQTFIKNVEDDKINYPDNSLEQLGNRICSLVIRMVDGENNTLKKILKELETKTNSTQLQFENS